MTAILSGVWILSAPASLAADPPTMTVSSTNECGVYAAAIGDGPFKDIGLFTTTINQFNHQGYEIRCDWGSFGVNPPTLVGLPSPACASAIASHVRVAEACGLPSVMISVSRPIFSDKGTKASLRIDYVPTHDVIGGHGDDCDFIKTTGKWRQIACQEAWIS